MKSFHATIRKKIDNIIEKSAKDIKRPFKKEQIKNGLSVYETISTVTKDTLGNPTGKQNKTERLVMFRMAEVREMGLPPWAEAKLRLRVEDFHQIVSSCYPPVPICRIFYRNRCACVTTKMFQTPLFGVWLRWWNQTTLDQPLIGFLTFGEVKVFVSQFSHLSDEVVSGLL